MVIGEVPIAIKAPITQPLPRGGNVLERPVGMPIKPQSSERAMARNTVASNIHSQRLLDIRRQLKPAQFGLEAFVMPSSMLPEATDQQLENEVVQQEPHKLADTFMLSMAKLIRVGLMLIGL